MARTLTIELSDAEYEALCAAADAAHISPEQLAASSLARRLDMSEPVPQTHRQARDAFIQRMRDQGVFLDPSSLPKHPLNSAIPAYGTPEWAAALREIEEDSEDDVDWSRVNFADWVERR